MFGLMIEIMLFRQKNGTFIEINRLDYKNDTLYYSKIMELKRNSLVQNLNAMESFLQNKKGNMKK